MAGSFLEVLLVNVARMKSDDKEIAGNELLTIHLVKAVILLECANISRIA